MINLDLAIHRGQFTGRFLTMAIESSPSCYLLVSAAVLIITATEAPSQVSICYAFTSGRSSGKITFCARRLKKHCDIFSFDNQ